VYSFSTGPVIVALVSVDHGPESDGALCNETEVVPDWTCMEREFPEMVTLLGKITGAPD
jgi:hypothetical protein